MWLQAPRHTRGVYHPMPPLCPGSRLLHHRLRAPAMCNPCCSGQHGRTALAGLARTCFYLVHPPHMQTGVLLLSQRGKTVGLADGYHFVVQSAGCQKILQYVQWLLALFLNVVCLPSRWVAGFAMHVSSCQLACQGSAPVCQHAWFAPPTCRQQHTLCRGPQPWALLRLPILNT